MLRVLPPLGRGLAVVLALAAQALPAAHAAGFGEDARKRAYACDDAACRAEVEAACGAGDSLACGTLGVLLVRGDEAAHERGAALLAAVCLGEGALCQDAARAADRRQSPERHLALLERGCDAGDAAVCRELAATRLRAGPEHSAPRALAALDRACAVEAFDCFGAAEARVVFGATSEQRRAGLLALHGLAEQRDPWALRALANIYWGGPSGVPEALRAEAAACFAEREFDFAPFVDECDGIRVALAARAP